MLQKKLKPPVTAFLVALAILLIAFVASTNLASASGGSISQANTYPQQGGSYLAVDHFTYQLSAVNVNTTVSVSIDGGPLIPMAFGGINNETCNSDTAPQGWYTWQTTIPTITESGNHTFQFFSHYYVWQDTDQYWAEFNARSTVYSFTIKGDPTVQSTSSPIATPAAAPQLLVTPELQAWIILPFIIVTLLLVFVKRNFKIMAVKKP